MMWLEEEIFISVQKNYWKNKMFYLIVHILDCKNIVWDEHNQNKFKCTSLICQLTTIVSLSLLQKILHNEEKLFIIKLLLLKNNPFYHPMHAAGQNKIKFIKLVFFFLLQFL